MPDEPVSAQARTTVQAILRVDLDALAQNWRRLSARAKSGPAGGECAAVVKADAYGLGLAPVARALLDQGCASFFVAHLHEGQELRRIAPAARIFILNGLPPVSSRHFVAARLIPVLGSLPEIAEWAEFCRAERAPHPAALHIDTGMNRLGLPAAELAPARALMAAFAPVLAMSHFISAEDRSSPRSRMQIERFERARAKLPPMPASLCNSSGMFLAEAPFLDLCRPGYALYGGNPTPGVENPMRPVVALFAEILQIREVEAGETVGYNGRWTAPSRRRLATLNLGYADGFLRGGGEVSPGAQAFAAGHFCPVVGRISMDLAIIDISDAGPLQRGDRVEILGPHISIDDLARRSGTIGYEILTRLGARFRREYVRDEKMDD
ncbi:alanine racemase [Rhodoblastus sp.]|uniref:alanine racemase n=1 Tax=Rhodoblastus sp. TaxID=1962975 RepID=UPI003F97128B